MTWFEAWNPAGARAGYAISLPLGEELHATVPGPNSGSPFKDGGFLRQHLAVLEIGERASSLFQKRTAVAMPAVHPYRAWSLLPSDWVCPLEMDGYPNRIRSRVVRIFIYDVFSFIYICFVLFLVSSFNTLPWLHTCSREAVNSIVLSVQTACQSRSWLFSSQ